MPRNITFSLNVPTSPGAGPGQLVRDLQQKYIQVAGTFTALFSIEGSLNGSDFATIQSGIASPGWYTIPQPISHLRVVTTSYTSGTPRVILGGFDVNG